MMHHNHDNELPSLVMPAWCLWCTRLLFCDIASSGKSMHQEQFSNRFSLKIDVTKQKRLDTKWESSMTIGIFHSSERLYWAHKSVFKRIYILAKLANKLKYGRIINLESENAHMSQWCWSMKKPGHFARSSESEVADRNK